MMPQSYEIRTVFDFLRVPIERRATCLLEFAQWLSVMEAGLALERAGLAKSREVSYRWVDDDMGQMRLTVTLTEGVGK